MEIKERQVGEVTFLDLEGKMTLGDQDSLGEFQVLIAKIVAEGRNLVCLNMAGVPYVDRAGLEELVRAFTTIARGGGKLKLMNVPKRVIDLLTMTNLMTFFDIFDLEEEVVESFKK